MDVWGVVRLGHALAGVSFLIGLVGMWVVGAEVRRQDSLDRMHPLMRVGEAFGRMTTGGGISLAVLGIAAAIGLGHPLLGPLQGGRVDWMFVSVLLMLPLFGFLALVYPPKGRAIAAALADAEARGVVTDELRAARNDRVLRWARRYELVAVIVVISLMIAKPF